MVDLLSFKSKAKKPDPRLQDTPNTVERRITGHLPLTTDTVRAEIERLL
jgi:hypothetical protein